MTTEIAVAERPGESERYRTLLEITNAVISNLSRHGGEIEITSRPGEGTCVRVTLPL